MNFLSHKKIINIASCLLLVASNSSFSATEIGSSQAYVVTGIQLSVPESLNFGVILPDVNGDQISLSSEAGSVRVSATGNSSFADNIYSRAKINVFGEPDGVVSFQYDETITLQGTGDDMSITGVNIIQDLALVSGTSYALGPDGYHYIFLGGTLNINANQTPGVYTGNYQVTASYQ